MILESVKNGLLIWPTIEENGVIRTKKYAELFAAKIIQANCDMKATNIILQGLPADIYSLVNHHRVAKDLRESIQLLMQGTSLTKQERECKLYDAFYKFTHIKEESLHNLPPEWSKFVTDFKLVKDLHTTNFDQLHAYLEQHELHANEVRDDPIACLNKAMAFLTAVASSSDDISNEKVVLMANISNYGSDLSQREKLALKEQVDSLEQNLSKQIKEKECLLQTFNVFKSESKEKEDKYMQNEIDLENKIKELDNILFKVGQSAQTVHMLTKPQAFYDNLHKQALGYQNPFHLKKAQWIKPTLYDGIVISDKHVVMPVIDDEETLILEKIDYLIKPSDASPVKIEAHKELPKVSLVNESLKKLKFHIARFDNVVKIRTTPDARTEGEWGFEHTKAIFNNEIISFLKSLKVIFKVFDRDLLNKIMEVQTVFDQMDAAVQQFSVDKQCLEIAKKELLLENDRLLQQIMSQDVLLTVMNFMSLLDDSDIIKSMREKSKEENGNYDYGEIETKNVELENSMAKLISENERLCNEINYVKHVFKEQFDSIKKTRVRTKEQSDSLIDKLNLKSTKNEDLKAQIQDKVFVITSLKNNL
ncbi:hypothetical protein Tco_1107545 [Tanacetum coccineum]